MIKRWATVKYKEDENVWLTYFKQQIYKKNNCINCLVTGMAGMGKSWGSLSQLTMFDPNFDLNEQLFFSASKMFRKFNDDKFFAKKGRCIMFDEAGIDFDNIGWQNDFNKGLKAFLETGRHRNYIFMLTVPFLTNISKGVRTLMNTRWQAMGWNKELKTIIAPRTMEYNDEKDKFYKKRLIVRHDGFSQFCDILKLPKPPKKMIIEYERLKKEFTTSLNLDIANRMDVYEKQRQMGVKKPILTYLQEQLLADLKEGMTVEQMANKRGCKNITIYDSINALRKKGIKIQSKIIDNKSKGFLVEEAI